MQQRVDQLFGKDCRCSLTHVVDVIMSMDFVRELRLRQWARKHFVSPTARKTTWHPVVLDEMGLRDHELSQAAIDRRIESAELAIRSRYLQSAITGN